MENMPLPNSTFSNEIIFLIFRGRDVWFVSNDHTFVLYDLLRSYLSQTSKSVTIEITNSIVRAKNQRIFWRNCYTKKSFEKSEGRVNLIFLFRNIRLKKAILETFQNTIEISLFHQKISSLHFHYFYDQIWSFDVIREDFAESNIPICPLKPLLASSQYLN